MTALELDGVAVDYGTFSLGPLDLSVGDEILSILGPSGCGKTTVLSVVAGIVTDHEGVVRLNGRSLNGLPPEQRHAALVFQDGALFPHMTVQQNIAYAATGDRRVDELASTFEIDDLLSRNAATLSGGERQRVALARALAADPDVLLLDEPLANLDAPVKRRLQFDLRDLLVEFDVPVVYVTHDQEHATTIGDRIAVMRDGQFEQIGTPSDVFERPATRHVAEFTGVSNRFLARVVERSDDGLVLDWHGHRIEAPAYEVSGEDVWFGLRPEYVMVLHEGSTADGRPNVLPGRLERRVFHGDGYRLTFKPDDVPETIEIRLPTPVYERLALGSRDHIRVSLKRSALFVRDRDV